MEVRPSAFLGKSQDDAPYDKDMETMTTNPRSVPRLLAVAMDVLWHRVRPGKHRLSLLISSCLPRFLKWDGSDCQHRLHSTSYLDALRGLAAFFVLNGHKNDLRNVWVLDLPIIRVVQTGTCLVDLFFVISGFVLSQRMLQQMQTQNKGKLLDSLTSSVFRRYLRLYTPCVIAAFISMLFVFCGWIEWKETPRQSTLGLQFWHWSKDTISFLNPFAGIDGWFSKRSVYSAYIEPTWTIPVEMRGSMAVYMFCAGTAKLKSNQRLQLGLLTIVASMIWVETYIALFLAGTMIAELSLLRFPERYSIRTRLPSYKQQTQGETIWAEAVWSSTFLISLYFISLPDLYLQTSSPGPQLAQFLPSYWSGRAKQHFWACFFSPLLIYSVDSSPFLQRPFNCRIPQYLGDLSFGIYLLHMIVLGSLWSKVLSPLANTYGSDSILAALLGTIVLWFVTFWAADYFERVDKKVVELGKHLQTSLFQTY